MAKVRQTKLTGKLYKHLGHFTKPGFVAEGHNTTPGTAGYDRDGARRAARARLINTGSAYDSATNPVATARMVRREAVQSAQTPAAKAEARLAGREAVKAAKQLRDTRTPHQRAAANMALRVSRSVQRTAKGGRFAY